MLAKTGLLALLGALPAVLACGAHTGGVPKATRTQQLSKPIYVKSGQVYDGQWARFERGPSTCNQQGEGGT